MTRSAWLALDRSAPGLAVLGCQGVIGCVVARDPATDELLFEAMDPGAALDADTDGRHLAADRNLFAIHRFEFITHAVNELE